MIFLFPFSEFFTILFLDQVDIALKALTDPEEQMDALMRLLELTKADLEQRTNIGRHIQVRN
jgi:hypothetical protein